MSSLFVFDGMKRPAFTVKIDVERATVADLFCEVAESYALDFNPRRNLRIIFVDKELKYTAKKKLCDVGIINHSTVAVIFRLPDKLPTEPATTEDADAEESVEVKIDEDNKNVVDTVTEMTDKENKDSKDVSTKESEQVKKDEDAREVSNADCEPVKKDEDAKKVSNAVCEPVKKDEDTKEVSNAESEQVKKDEDAKKVSNVESEPVKKDEDAKKVINAVCEPVKKDEDTKEVSNVESEPVKKDEDAKKLSHEKPEPVETDEDAKDAEKVSAASKRQTGAAAVSILEEEKRPVLRRLPEVVELAYLPDFLNLFDFTEARAILPCCHVMGSETMRSYCQNLIDSGNTKFACPYTLFPFSPGNCPIMWEYILVRYVACFTTKEMHNTEKTIAINFAGKDSITLTCPGCFTWCSKVDSKQTRLRCFLCSRETGKEFLFCAYCLREWKNARSGTCANPECKSIEATLDILRNSPVTSLYGGTWPTIRLCPRCGILTEFMGLCSQIHCQVCGYDYCFLCLKGANSKAELQCIPYNSPCQRASLQTSIPEWDGHNSD